ncbi:hypothetical protein [Cedecea sp.]|uniref:hypothetical protein n=1 Tax=Cedecea sp. TaxID=1970739 RepID=UPI002F4286F4
MKNTMKNNENTEKEESSEVIPFVESASLRDYFAAKAMASIPLSLNSGEQQVISLAAYAQADAMLKARSAHN